MLLLLFDKSAKHILACQLSLNEKLITIYLTIAV